MDYEAELRNTPAPGNGTHPHLLRLANLAAARGLTPQQAFQDIRAAIPEGRRRVLDSEIIKTIKKAFSERADGRRAGGWKPYKVEKRPGIGADSLRRRIMTEGSADECELWESSPVRLDGVPEADAALLLNHFYKPDDFIFIGDTYDKQVMTVAEWLTLIEHSGTAGLPHIIPNPLTGEEHETASGTMSRRCDAAVACFRFVLIEFDNMPRNEQIQFWSGIISRNLLPVACLIDSGGKSLHAWIRAGVADRAGWDAKVKQKLFAEYMIPLGADPTSRNPARLSRLPGHFRVEKNRWQRLLWLNTKEV